VKHPNNKARQRNPFIKIIKAVIDQNVGFRGIRDPVCQEGDSKIGCERINDS
jgi:hypothetical protein